MQRLVTRVFVAWLPVAVAVTCLGALGYLGVQQAYRNGANDPQLQMAHDAANALGRGASPESVVKAHEIAVAADGQGEGHFVVLDEPGASLAPFVIVYDVQGRPVAASARLGGKIPQAPRGVLDSAKATGQNIVTWQPTSSLRIAAVAVPVGKGEFVVVAGRSLKAIEGRIHDLTTIAFVGWLGTLMVTFLATLVAEKLRERA